MAEQDTVFLKLLTPEKPFMVKEVEQLLVPAEEGDVAVLPKRAPYMLKMRQGLVRATLHQGKASEIFVDGGYAKIRDNGCTILTTYAVDRQTANKSLFKALLEKRKKVLQETKVESLQKLLQGQIRFFEMVIASLS